MFALKNLEFGDVNFQMMILFLLLQLELKKTQQFLLGKSHVVYTKFIVYKFYRQDKVSRKYEIHAVQTF